MSSTKQGEHDSVDLNLVGRCGLYCGVCRIYRAYRDSPRLQTKLAEEFDCAPEEVKCEGCQKLKETGWDKEKYWGANCRIAKCLERKHIDFCYDCAEFAFCGKFDKFAKICLRVGIDLRVNLEQIRGGDVNGWLIREMEKWKCVQCSRPISADLDNCHWCGSDLSTRRA